MTWIYFDESGEHKAGKLQRLTLGCAIASCDQWNALEGPWRKIIADAGIDFFHMVDFEARQPPYDGWSDDKRRKVLNDLLELMRVNIPRYWGVSDFADEINSVRQFRAAYQKNVIKLFMEMVADPGSFPEGPINVVFAKHKNISNQFIGRFFDLFDYWLPSRLKFGGFGEPVSLPQLQAADIVAYEFSRTARKERPDRERYPLVRLAEKAREFTLYHASRFGLEHYEWGADQSRRRFEG
jgi:hypothetical protein